MLTVASCAKELLEPAELSGETVTLTLNLGDGTKTAYQNGKTVWKAGDKVLISDGKNKVEVAIPSEGAGLSGCAVTLPAESLSFDGNLYAVYPVSAFASAAGDVINVTIPNDQSGLFEEANVCVAKSTDGVFMLKNATAVMKIRVEDDVETVMISGSTTDTLAGKLAVTYTDAETPVTVKASSPVKSVKIAAGGLGDTYYAAVVPGKYEEISVLALTLDGKSQRKTTTNKTLKVNDMANLGVIGDELSGSSMEGTGTEDDPLLIKDLGDITTLATFVSNGMTYEGMYLKVVNDIEDITVPIGAYDQADFYFLGDFDGNNKTLTLALGGDECADDYVALFGDVGPGAHIHDLTLAGSVKSSGNDIAALIGCINAGAGAVVENITNNATVTGGTTVGGIIAYGDSDKEYVLEVKNCTNNGAVTGVDQVGGIFAAGTKVGIDNCTNTGTVKSTSDQPSQIFGGANNAYFAAPGGSYKYATAGVLAWGQNCYVTNCQNSGSVTAFFKLGGILGAGNWTPVANCTNAGAIVGTGHFESKADSQMGCAKGSVAGGIVGWVHGGGNVTGCTNSAPITGLGSIGGIAGVVNGYNSTSSRPSIINCENTGDVTATGVYNGGVGANNPGTGGILGDADGYMRANRSELEYSQFVTVKNCKNTGAISSDQKNVGGILGKCFGTSNGFWGVHTMVDGCVNEGSVTGTFWIGGIVGYSLSRYATQCKITNCANHGTVLGTRSDRDSGVAIGGIIGAFGAISASYTTGKAQHLVAYNNYNDGEIVYSTTTFVNPYAGGIIGNVWGNSTVQNCYNSAYVGPVGYVNLPAGAAALIGGVAANQTGNYVRFCYSAEDCVPEGVGVVGTKGTAAADTNTTFDVDGLLGTTVTVNSVECSTLLQVLNAWINGKTDYLTWVDGADGPVFNK